MLKLTDEQLDWLCKRIPDAAPSPSGGRPPIGKRDAVRGVFRIPDNGATWKDLPSECGSKSAVHHRFTIWVNARVFEKLRCDAGQVVEERGAYRLYECFIDATFSKAKGGSDGIGVTKAGKCVKLMVLVDARGLPVAMHTASETPYESRLVQGLFDFMLTSMTPDRAISDNSYDSDALDDQLRVKDRPDRPAPRQPHQARDPGRPRAPPVPTALDLGARDRLGPELPPPVHPLGEIHDVLPRLPPHQLLAPATQRDSGIASRETSDGQQCEFRATADAALGTWLVWNTLAKKPLGLVEDALGLAGVVR